MIIIIIILGLITCKIETTLTMIMMIVEIIINNHLYIVFRTYDE